MATSEQIAAAAHQVKPGRGDGFVDRKAHHLLGGAHAGDDTEQARAARHILRFAPDPEQAADALGLTLPPGPDTAGPLVQLAARGDTDGVRAWLDSRTLTEISAIRAALGRRDR